MLIIYTDSKLQISCNFEDPYICGYTSDMLGSSSWVRKQASDTGAVPGGPTSDASNSSNGMDELKSYNLLKFLDIIDIVDILCG